MEDEELLKLAKQMRLLAHKIEKALGVDEEKQTIPTTRLIMRDGLNGKEIARSTLRGETDEVRIEKRQYRLLKTELWRYVANTYFTYEQKKSDKAFFQSKLWKDTLNKVKANIKWETKSK